MDDDFVDQFDLNFLDFDTVCKDIPKLAFEDQVKGFSQSGVHYLYNPPFLLFFNDPEPEQVEALTQANFTQSLLLPTQQELAKIYEDFYLQKLPREPILMLKS